MIQESDSQELKAQPSKTPRKAEAHRPRMIMNTPRRVVAPDQRIPSMLLGEGGQSSASTSEEAVKETELPTEQEHKDEVKRPYQTMHERVAANRAKYSSKMNAKRLNKEQIKLTKPSKPESTKPEKKEEIVEEPVDPNVDE